MVVGQEKLMKHLECFREGIQEAFMHEAGSYFSIYSVKYIQIGQVKILDEAFAVRGSWQRS